MVSRTLLLLVVGAINWVGCDSRTTSQPGTGESAHVPSPSGWCEAYVVEFDFGPNGQTTQVMLSFDGGQGGAGAVSAPGLKLGLNLRWLDPTTLEVEHPKGVQLTYGASGEVLQFLNHKVRVVLKAV